jgi:molecular chaperone IbpA
MVSSFALDLFKDPFFIGFNRELERLNTVHNLATRQAYPPYDIQQLDDKGDNFLLSMALAGFPEHGISVTLKDRTLVIEGDSKTVTEDLDETPTSYIHKGIANRKFTKSFALGEHMEIGDATLRNGMLEIVIYRNIPEDKKPKQIKVKVAK